MNIQGMIDENLSLMVANIGLGLSKKPIGGCYYKSFGEYRQIEKFIPLFKELGVLEADYKLPDWKSLRIMAKDDLFRQSGHDAGKFPAVESGAPLAAGTLEGHDVLKGSNGTLTDRTVYRQMVSTPGFALKKCAAVFNKFFALLRCGKISLHFYMLFFESGIFLLQCFYALCETRDIFFKGDDAFAQDGVDWQTGENISESFEHNNPHK